MIRSFRERQEVDLGFDPRGAFSARLTLSGERYREASARYAFLDEVLRRIRTLPGVTNAGAATSLPFSDELGGGFSTATFEVDGREVPAAERPSTVVQAVTVDALATFGIAILDGRGFAEAEVAEGADTVVVSEGLARRFWPGADPLGRRLRLSSGDWLRVIGVAREVKEASSILGLELKPAWQIYLPYPRRPTSTVTLVVRGGAADSLAGPVREAVRGLDPLLPFYEARTLEEARRRADWVARLWGQILAWAAGAGTLLACVGVYGVVGRGVARRTNEIGIRMALGADRGAVLRLVLAQSLRPSLLGVGLGVLAALAVTRSLSGLLYGVSASDPLTLLGSGLLLTAVAALATYLPARRAASVDPIAALRSE
jgi:putative ABC transport system permease protein